jgi:hypothetical protein
MPKTKVDVFYFWDGKRRFATILLPIRHAENAYAWLKMHFPYLNVLDTRGSNRL